MVHRALATAIVILAGFYFGRLWLNAISLGELDYAAGQCLMFFGLSAFTCGIVVWIANELRFARHLLYFSTLLANLAAIVLLSHCVVLSETGPILIVLAIQNGAFALILYGFRRKAAKKR